MCPARLPRPPAQDWPEDDFRIFAGNLGNDVNVDTLSKAFSRYPSFQKAKACPAAMAPPRRAAGQC